MARLRTLLLSSLLLLASTGVSLAQFGQSDLVSGTGVVAISRPPETLRLQIAIMGRGATLKDALAALKDRTTKAQTQLVTLGADKATMKVGDARVAELNNDRNRQMQMMMMQRMRAQAGGRKTAQKAQPAPPVVVSAQLTAEWKLTSTTTEELLLTVHPLQEKVKAADLAGTKEAEKLTPEQQEMLEEAEQNFGGYSSNDEAKPGEPVFVFVARISDADRDKAMAEAFVKAKDQATRLAKAAGAQLGNLKSLSASGQSAAAYAQYGGGSQAYRAMQMMRQQEVGSDDESLDEKEALGTDAAPVKFNVSVMAAFELAPKK